MKVYGKGNSTEASVPGFEPRSRLNLLNRGQFVKEKSGLKKIETSRYGQNRNNGKVRICQFCSAENDYPHISNLLYCSRYGTIYSIVLQLHFI